MGLRDLDHHRGESYSGADDIVDFDDESSKVEERSRSRSGGRLSRGNKKLGLNPASKQNPTGKGTALVSPMSLPSDDVKIGDTVPLSADKGDENPDAKSSGSVNATPRRASLRSSRRRSQGEQMPRLRKDEVFLLPPEGAVVAVVCRLSEKRSICAQQLDHQATANPCLS